MTNSFVKLKQAAYSKIEERFRCAHASRAIRRRIISDGRPTYVSQCIECGHTSSPIKTQDALALVPSPEPYDPYLQARRFAAKSTEYFRAYIELRPALGAEYKAYLGTREWQQRRRAAIERANGKCEICFRRATEVHHLTYQRLGAELPQDLMAVCRECHEFIHEYRP